MAPAPLIFNPKDHDPYNVQALRYVTLAAVVIASWEHLLWLDREYAIWKKLILKRQISFSSIVVLCIRYSLLWSSVCASLFFFGRPSSCQTTLSLLWTGFTFCWISIAVLFGFRVWIIWNKNSMIALIMIVTGILSVGAWIAVDSQWRAFSIVELGVPLGPKDPWCSQAYGREWHQHKWHQINWGGSMAFDVVVLFLVILRLRQLPKFERHNNSVDMRTYILKSNLGYFLVSFAINFAAFIAQLTVTNIDIAQMPTPLAFTLTPVVAARVIFQTSEHSPSSSSSNSLGNSTNNFRKGNRSHGPPETNGKSPLSHQDGTESRFSHAYQQRQGPEQRADSFTERGNDSYTPSSDWTPEAAKNSGVFDATEDLALSELNVGWRPAVFVETQVHTSPKFE